MTTPEPASPDLSDISKSLIVPVSGAEAFRIFTQRPMDWVPPTHRYLADASLIAFEPSVGGRFFERNPAGAEAVHGTITEWEPPLRLTMTWRVGENWQPVTTDDDASFIVLTFNEIDSNRTEVVLTHTGFERHGAGAPAIRALVDGPSPGETLARFGDAVARQVASA